MQHSPQLALAFSSARRCALLLALCGICALLAGCAESTMTLGMAGETATPYHFRYNAGVHTRGPYIHVRPNASPNFPPTALLMPLRVLQDMREPRALAIGVTRQIWNVWLEQSNFSALEFNETVIPHTVQDAMGIARRRGAQLLIGGYIEHIIDGSVNGQSSLSLRVDVFEVASGAQLWSISQSASIEKGMPTDLFLLGVEARMPGDPMSQLIKAVAYDLGAVFGMWISPTSGGTGANNSLPGGPTGSGGVSGPAGGASGGNMSGVAF